MGHGRPRGRLSLSTESSQGRLLGELCGDQSQPVHARTQACLELGQMGSREALPTLLGLAGLDGPETVIWEALSAIGAIRSRTATRPLLTLLRTTRSESRRHGIVLALSMLADARALGTLGRLLLNETEDLAVREMAAEALGLLKPAHRSLRALTVAARDREPRVRYSALCAIGALRDRSALPVVRLMLQDHAELPGEGSIAMRARQVLSTLEDSNTLGRHSD